MNIVVDIKTSVATGNFGSAAARLSMKLEGRKVWMAHNKLRFETSRHNIDCITAAFPAAVVQDRRSGVAEYELLSESHRPSVAVLDPNAGFVLPPLDFQLENFNRFKDKLFWAIFSEQGTGKTKVAWDIISHRFLKRTVTGVIILSDPKGVHAQWIEEQLPRHLWKAVKALTYIWEGKKPPSWLGKDTPELQIISGNIDMVKGKGFKILQEFVRHHRRNCLILVDESDTIKNIASVRNVKLRELAVYTQQRAIMSGTPIAKDLTDEWAQFYFLNPDVIGHKYLTSFRAQFCLMGGFENRSVVGHKNVEELKRVTAPHIFRAMKSELGLPPKVHDSVVFDLGATQKRLIRELRDQFFASLSNGATVAVKTGAVALLRMQQISCGFTQDENGVMHLIENPRMDALLRLRQDVQGPVMIWCRFKQDIVLVKQQFAASGVTYFGESSPQERDEAKKAFIGGRAQEFIATAGAAGKGLDGMQTVCSNAIYYSNSYNSIDRWQSEDRIHRYGTKGTATYFDLIGRGSPDRGVLNNLRRKKDIASLALDDLKAIMDDIQ